MDFRIDDVAFLSIVERLFVENRFDSGFLGSILSDWWMNFIMVRVCSR